MTQVCINVDEDELYGAAFSHAGVEEMLCHYDHEDILRRMDSYHIVEHVVGKCTMSELLEHYSQEDIANYLAREFEMGPVEDYSKK